MARLTTSLGAALLGALWLAGCGSAGGGGVSALAFAGTVSVTSASPGGACVSTTLVTFSAMGTDLHTLSVPGGACLDFLNADAAPHQPAAFGTSPCAQLNGPSLATNQHYVTPPFDGPATCQWQDALHPIPAGGGNGY